MNNEQQRQLAKEEAVKKGIQRGMALMREDLKKIESIPIEETINKAEEYLNNWKRERADFINYKKDEAKRMDEFLKFSTEGIIMELIDVIDGIGVARNNLPRVEELREWTEGFDGSLDKIDKFLKKFRVEKIKVQEEKFDPLLHEAVEVEDKDGEKIEEIRPGYTMHGKVIRPARVKIIN